MIFYLKSLIYKNNFVALIIAILDLPQKALRANASSVITGAMPSSPPFYRDEVF
jgi:hypothetical protein